ncbi:uncharacterized protein O3C94_018683 isoform 1-T3 [Discoglossus pictus]
MRSEAESVNVGSSTDEAAFPEDSVIVISDDEGQVTLGLSNSVLLIEDFGEESFVREKKIEEVLDEELAITFSRKANVMPHARYDCTLHPFMRAEEELQIPLEENACACQQCYCYLCDKVASECPDWTTPSKCHCNAHNKSKYWKEQRDSALAGVLTIFNFTLTEIDKELREGGNKLQIFIDSLSVTYSKYLEGTMVSRETLYSCTCACHRRTRSKQCNICHMNHIDVLFYSYSPVYQMITEYLDEAEKESPKTAAVMLLGAVKEIITHKLAPNNFASKDPTANVKQSTVLLMSRITTTLQRLLVLSDYPKNIFEKLIGFFQSLHLPPHCYSFISCLNVYPWDSLFLTAVLAGQNVTGQRTVKGKKEFLWESICVVQSRVKKLEEEKSYRQLVRYLNAVRCPDVAGVTFLRQKSCFYMCKYGDFSSAVFSMLNTKNNSLINLITPTQFELYLTMFRTSSCPPGNEPVAEDVWVPQAGQPLKKGILVRTAIRILYANMFLAQEPKCWSALIRTWCMSDTLTKDQKVFAITLPEPDPFFLNAVLGMSCSILGELQRQMHINLPDPFHKCSRSAELILIIQVIIQFMMNALRPLHSMLELILAFGRNVWALSLLIDGMAPMEILLNNFINNLHQELNADEHHMIDELEQHGFPYVSQILELFLRQRSERARSFGFHILDIILRNKQKFSWSPKVASYLKNTVLILKHFNISELQMLKGKIGRLSSRS